PDIRAVIHPNFDISKPASGKLEFEVLSSYQKVPPTSSDIRFYNAGGAVIARTSIANPGGKAKFSWYTQNVTNGVYTVQVTHRVGTLYTYESKKVEFEIQN